MSYVDPFAHLDDPNWTRKNAAGFTESPHVFFKDGTSILVCTGSPDLTLGFRVHKSILAANSSVFSDMFSLGDGLQAEKTFEGCPMIYLPDDSFAMNNLMRMFYERSYGRNLNDFTLGELEGILRLANKYMVYHVRVEIVEHLEKLFPSTIRGYRERSPLRGDCLLGFKIAVDFDLPILIPCALYLCSLCDADEILHSSLEPYMIQEILTFKDNLAKHIVSDVLSSDWFPTERSCVNPNTSLGCNGIDPITSRRIVVAYMDRTVDVFAADPTQSLRGLTKPQCCVACLRERDRVENEAYKPILWNLLPVFTNDDREWNGWHHVQQAHREAVKTWVHAPPGAIPDGS